MVGFLFGVNMDIPVYKQDLAADASLADVIAAINLERRHWRDQRDIVLRRAEERAAERNFDSYS